MSSEGDTALRGLRAALAAAACATGGLVGSLAMVSYSADQSSSTPQPPKAPAEIFSLLEEYAAKDRFVGTVHGWRLAPREVLETEGVAKRNLSLPSTCETTVATAGSHTDLDFTLSYFPTSIKVEAVSQPVKWVCGSKGLGVMWTYNLVTPYGEGALRVERFITGTRSISTYVANDAVTEGTINGKPAIFVVPVDAATGLGYGMIAVIEDDVGDEFTVLRLISDGAVPFDELVKMAEGAK